MLSYSIFLYAKIFLYVFLDIIINLLNTWELDQYFDNSLIFFNGWELMEMSCGKPFCLSW
jgi:hypothetical protein